MKKSIEEIKLEIQNLEYYIHSRELGDESGANIFSGVTLFNLYEELNECYKELSNAEKGK